MLAFQRERKRFGGDLPEYYGESRRPSRHTTHLTSNDADGWRAARGMAIQTKVLGDYQLKATPSCRFRSSFAARTGFSRFNPRRRFCGVFGLQIWASDQPGTAHLLNRRVTVERTHFKPL